jgi:hypothetical protein
MTTSVAKNGELLMQFWRANLIALVHFAIGGFALMVYAFIDSSVEQAVPRHVVPATLIAFGITMWAGCRCAYSYGLRDSAARPDAET